MFPPISAWRDADGEQCGSPSVVLALRAVNLSMPWPPVSALSANPETGVDRVLGVRQAQTVEKRAPRNN
jgi:hypothetical protein